LGTAYATFPGENGVIVYSNAGVITKQVGTFDAPATPLGAGSEPMVSPDGKRIAYSYLDGQGNSRVAVMNIDGSNVVDLTAGNSPGWSPEGTMLAFFSKGQGPDHTYSGIYTISPNGQSPTFFAGLNYTSTVSRISWSPSGDTIAFDFNGRVATIGGGVMTMVAPSLGVGEPSWTPDGRLVARVMDPTSGAAGSAYMMNADGSNAQLLNGPQGGYTYPYARYPIISPDGLQLLAGVISETGSPLLWTKLLSQAPMEYRGDGAVPDWSRAPKTAMRTTLVNGQWTTAAPLASEANTYIEQSAVAVMPAVFNGVVQQVVGIGQDGKVYHRGQLTPSGTWTSWALVPGIGGSSAGVRAKRVAIAGGWDGSCQVAIVGDDNLVYHAGRYANGSWSGFNKLDGYGTASFAARDVSISITGTTNSPGTAHVVANSLDAGNVYYRSRQPSGSWTTWVALPGSLTNTGEVSVAATYNGDAYVMVTHPTMGIQRQLRWANGNWDGWLTMGAPQQARDVSVGITYDASSQPIARVVYVGLDGETWYEERPSANKQSAWTGAVTRTSLLKKGSAVSISSFGAIEMLIVQLQPQ
jgi:hypothetical protein